jgi:predicted metalloprotease with PDZ domain
VGDGYGGLEHKNSTALMANRSDLPRLHQNKASEGYIQLLGLFSHEYFHTWNIKRLRPLEFKSLDLHQENYTELLWFFEGFTSYYDDLVLVRSGLIEVSDYLKLLTKTLNQVLQTPGRKIHSVAQASFEAWTKYYRPQPNTANTTVSYYTKGALIALCLDLTLRKIDQNNLSPLKRGKKSTEANSQHAFNLDIVMRKLWDTCKDGLMTESTLLTLLFELTGVSFKKNLQNWVHTTAELPVIELLEYFGVKAQYEPAQWAQKFGLRTSESSSSNLVIKQVLNESIAHKAGLCEGDEWIGIEIISKRIDPSQRFWRITKLEDIQLYAGNHRYINALISRDKKIFFLKLDLKELANIKTLRLIGTESLLLDTWLKQL